MVLLASNFTLLSNSCLFKYSLYWLYIVYPVNMVRLIYPSIPSIRMKKKDGDRIIKIKENTHERLKKLGKYGETMDDIIKRCVDAYESQGV